MFWEGNECSGWFEINFAAAAAITLSSQVDPSASAKGNGQMCDCFCSLQCLSKHRDERYIFLKGTSSIGHESSQKYLSTFCAFFSTVQKLTRSRKIFWDLELSRAWKSGFTGNPDQFDVVPFPSPPSCYASEDVNPAWLLLLFYIKCV